jgi:formiminotetrahydrofolate cyclodeaminase
VASAILHKDLDESKVNAEFNLNFIKNKAFVFAQRSRVYPADKTVVIQEKINGKML